ncbi:MAG: patatin-like phospholipase family protein [Bacteroidetes bacterium]|nr:patatin-like phospholipase family protein [Bacteroidota bacterium]
MKIAMPIPKKKTIQPIKLFENIALTFSGGGYRASTFGLGILSYLNQARIRNKSLLENVKGLSTVSGGTLTGATYACSAAEGKDFNTFYTHFYKTLEEDRLLGIALAKLDSNELWKNSHKKRSLINAFALAYAELLANNTFRCLREQKSHLEDICFNATDFSFGLAFRFQTSGIFGNYHLQNTNLDALSNDMKIADAIASSSCFPMGFEPMVLPDDYVSDHNSTTYVAIKAQKEFKKGVGIMDGGIVDNQGIGSIMNINVRREKEGKPYDLIMVCDVGSYFMDPWQASKLSLDGEDGSASPKKIYQTVVKKLRSSWWIWLLPIPIAAALLIGGFYSQNGTWLFIGGGAMVMFAILAGGARLFIDKIVHKILKTWGWVMGMLPHFMRDKLVYFENLRLRLIQRMLEERGTSAMKMISEIFLKQIRRLNYNLFYEHQDLKDRRITALIYELTKEQYQNGKSDEKEPEVKRGQIPDPGDGIYAAAKIASEMGTTLWFSVEDKKVYRLKNLVSCGQFTACFNLLKYCVDLKSSKAKVDPELLDEMIKVFANDWKKFIKNPYWLHDQYRN